MDGCYQAKVAGPSWTRVTGTWETGHPSLPGSHPTYGMPRPVPAFATAGHQGSPASKNSLLIRYYFFLLSSGARPIVSSEFRTWGVQPTSFQIPRPFFFFPCLVARQKPRLWTSPRTRPLFGHFTWSLRFFVAEGSRISKFPSITIPVSSRPLLRR